MYRKKQDIRVLERKDIREEERLHPDIWLSACHTGIIKTPVTFLLPAINAAKSNLHKKVDKCAHEITKEAAGIPETAIGTLPSNLTYI